ncbi:MULTISPECIES: undecaprenyldiphospho-muramoylpentapeptide beta-N-acetylglucosaminyltransferase [Bacillus]|uniref:UDP-N-acetylglucosamine--N-acetylmuramyl-(pentapeptide) pyrophosphoryl-undecaprenol N-acetylglucosamine transferase n=1 Tax=Bacillus thuringiensis serovar sooncheon TaxID=180891 RepID=A0A9Q5SBJ5_BACTU|nr:MULTISPECIES: undecaprenyldiphospho-muramoylpentapeptide beta-N-acetylglucosaminyltransferase [Bacillus]OTW73785.1 undecaprenyldiphospho-muramoylpentapeptide beta-N-acetylglucosaminyltransferase [Bacillus thuringiensis serovar coreanensis]OTX41250.1 undecaprenyldiphospho-muramoylpentapeptide beta-N-acetylglucosaminyltransferase [Bacillus thuringiensis serovar sooncheon]OTX47254.1 undecaprenyldiphospho-muramoylpentapeptide beta-N-acetylglucosaminyltransferase [Bacillus thuringiensis serovar gu
MNKKILFTGGGTAGHVMINMVLIPKFMEKGWGVEYIGSQNGIEKLLVQNVKYNSISTGKLRRYWDWENFKDPFKIIKGCIQSYKLMKRIKPDVIFSAGGFVSVPVVIGAWMNKVPVIIREPDSTLGLANKIALPFTTKLCTTFPQTGENVSNEKKIYVGPIVREEIERGNVLRGRSYCKFQQDKPVLLIMGGSQGAQWINDMVRGSLEALLLNFNIVHMCGKGKVDSSIGMEGYIQFEYIGEELPHILNMASVVVSRAGSTAISELLFLKKPMLLIPLTNSSSRGDQVLNAEYFSRQGYAEVIFQDKVSTNAFIHAVNKLNTNKERYIQNMNGYTKTNDEGIHQLIDIINEVVK